MGIMEFVKGGVGDLFVGRPPQCANLFVYKHNNNQIPNGARLEVNATDCAVFFKNDNPPVVAVLPPGRYSLSTQNIPFLSRFVANWTQGNAFHAELYFVYMMEIRLNFGGPLGSMIDPLTKESVQPKAYGSYMMKVINPTAFVLGCVTQPSIVGDNDKLAEWFGRGIMQVLGRTLDGIFQTRGGSFLELAKIVPDLKEALIRDCPDVTRFGATITQIFDLNVNLSAEEHALLAKRQAEFAQADREVLLAEKGIGKARAMAMQKQFELDQQFQQDARYVQQLAGGNYQAFAAGRAMMGAGEGLAKGEGGSPGIIGAAAQMAMGVGMAMPMQQMWSQPQQAQQPPLPVAPPAKPGGTAAPASGGAVTCPKCAGQVPLAKFCLECGAALPQPKRFCAECGLETGAAAKFCPNCGKAVGPSAG